MAAVAAPPWLAELEALPWLEPPFEILELEPEEEKVLTVIDYKIGKAIIHPRWAGAPEEKLVKMIRLYVPPEEKPLFPHYWDVAARTLVAQLEKVLQEADVPRHKVRIRIKKVGKAPKARFLVQVLAVM